MGSFEAGQCSGWRRLGIYVQGEMTVRSTEAKEMGTFRQGANH